MTKLAQLQEQRRTIAAQIEQLRNAFKAAGDKWPDDTQRQAWKQANEDYDATLRQLEEVRAALEVHGRADTIRDREERRQHQPNAKSRRMPGQDDPAVRAGDKPAPPSEEERCLALQAWCRRQVDLPLTDAQKRACKRVGIDYRSGRLNMPLPRHERFRRMQEAFRRAHPNLAEERALSAVTGSGGAFTIPEGFVNAFEVNMLAFGPMLQVSEILRTESGNELPWPTADDTSNEGEIVGENQGQNDADPNFGAVILRAYKFSSKFIKVPVELLEDSAFDLAVELGRMLGERIGRRQNRAFTTGTGANQPRGIVEAASLGVTAASATAIADTEVVRLVHSVDPAYRTADAAFMAHDNTFLAIRLLKDSQGRFIWRAGLELGQPDRLLGYVTYVNQHMASTIATTNKTLLFGQLRKYKVRQVRSLRMRRLVERFAELDQEGFLALQRADGNLLDAGTAPVKYLQQA